MGKRLTTEGFIQKAREIHGDRYDYSKVEYVNATTKVCVICPEHGEFWQKPYQHLRGVGCPKCSKTHKYTTISFVDRVTQIHGNRYDYSKVEYVNNRTKVCIICPEHGEFWQRAADHLNGRGCNKCIGFNKSTENFIEQIKTIHGDKYDYSKVGYKNIDTKICIICKKHGEFWQTPYKHIKRSQGCPKCKMSSNEEQVKLILDKIEVAYIYQASKDDLPWLGNQKIDFYLPNQKLAIECQGIQHFEPVDFAGNGEEWANKLYENNIIRDKAKKNKCEKHSIDLEYITFDKDITEQTKQILKKYGLQF